MGDICKETAVPVTETKVVLDLGFDPVGFLVFTFAKAKHNSSDVTRQRERRPYVRHAFSLSSSLGTLNVGR